MGYTEYRRLRNELTVSVSGVEANSTPPSYQAIEEGRSFVFSSGAELSAGHKWELYLESPSLLSASVLIQWRSTGSAILAIYENPTLPSGSTSATLTFSNMNRNSSNVAITKIWSESVSAGPQDISKRIYYHIIDSPESMPLRPTWETHMLILKTGQEKYLLQFINDDLVLGRIATEIILQES